MAMLALGAVACGAPSPPAAHADQAHGHEHAPPPSANANANANATSSAISTDLESLSVPPVDPDGPGIQAKALVDTPALKVMTIRLRGVALPPHESDVPVVITALSGSGTVVVKERRLRIDSTHAVTLAPRVEHSVAPDAGADLVLLVTHARGRHAP